EGRRQLPQERPELRRLEQRLDPLEQERQMLVRLEQALDVRDVAADLHREDEVRRALRHPARDGSRAGQAVEGVVQLDGVEVLRVVAEPAGGRTALRIEDAMPPV